MIGRNRTLAASTIATAGGTRSRRCRSSAKSIIMIAFFSTMPINMMMPDVAVHAELDVRQVQREQRAERRERQTR